MREGRSENVSKRVLGRCVAAPALTRTGGCGSSRGGTRCPRGAGLVWVCLGLVYRRPRQLGEDVPPADLAHEWGEVTGGGEVTIGHETALVASVGAFGWAQRGFHRTTGRTGFRGGIPAVRDHDAAPCPGGFVLELPAELTHADPGDVAGEAPVFQHAGKSQPAAPTFALRRVRPVRQRGRQIRRT